MANIRVDQMADAIVATMKAYSEVATDVLKDAATHSSNLTKTELQFRSPARTGKYGKNWTSWKRKETADSIQFCVHNRKKYQLTHLLEHGHAKRNGGRVNAQPHIAPAEQAGVDDFIERIEQGLRRRGR